MRLRAETLHDASRAISGKRFDFDQCLWRDATCLHIRFIHEGDHPTAENSAVAVIQTSVVQSGTALTKLPPMLPQSFGDGVQCPPTASGGA
jgi:hypothetical protein